MDLTTILFVLSLPFVLLTIYFGTKNDFYESENYKGDGCAHDVKRWSQISWMLNTKLYLFWSWWDDIFFFVIPESMRGNKNFCNCVKV